MPVIKAKYKASNTTLNPIPVVYGSTTSAIDNNYLISYNTDKLDPSILFKSGTVSQALDKMDTDNPDFIIGYDNNAGCALAIANGKLLSSNIVNITETDKEQNGTIEKFLSIRKVDKNSKTLKDIDVLITLNNDIKTILDNINLINFSRTKDSSAAGSDTSNYVYVYVHATAGIIDDVSVKSNNIASARELGILTNTVTTISNDVLILKNNTKNLQTIHTVYELGQYGEPFNSTLNIQFDIRQSEIGKIINSPLIRVNYAALNEDGTIKPGISTDIFATDLYNYKYDTSIKPAIDLLNTSVNKNENSIKTLNTSVNKNENSIKDINSSISSIKTDISSLRTDITNVNNSLNTNVSNINSSINSIKSSITGLNNSVSTINTKISDINSSISTNKTNISNLTNRIKAIEDLNVKDGESAGFGTISAKIGTNDPAQSPSVSVSASGPNTAKNFEFIFNNIKGKDGTSTETLTYKEATSDTLGLVKIGYNNNAIKYVDNNIYIPVKLLDGKMYVEFNIQELYQKISEKFILTPVFLSVT